MVAARELGGSDAAILFQGQHGEPMMCDDFFEPRQRRMWQLQLSLHRAGPPFTAPGLRDKRGGTRPFWRVANGVPEKFPK